MKTTKNLLVAGTLAAFSCSIASAQIIYSNAFNGAAVTINGTAPTVANDYAGGASSALWNSVIGTTDPAAMLADGTVDTHQNSVLLPFTPQAGYVYLMTASVTVPAMTAGKWITLGFAAHDPVNNTTPRFNDSAVNGNPWTYLTEGSGGDFFFATRTASIGSAQLMPTPTTYTVSLELDTTGAHWTIAEFINGTQLSTNYTYSANPTIVAAGIGQTTLSSSAGIQWDDWTLTVVPEPSAPALIGGGLTMMFLATLYRRRRHAAERTICKKFRLKTSNPATDPER